MLSAEGGFRGADDGFPDCCFHYLYSLIQFTDDSLFFLEVDLEGFRTLRCIFLMMEVASGFKNLHERKIMAVRQVLCMRYIADIMGCVVMSLPFTYLGFPIGESIDPPRFGTLSWRDWSESFRVGGQATFQGW